MSIQVYPLKNTDIRGCAFCHAKSFPKPWSEEEIKSFLKKDAVFGFAAKRSAEENPSGFILGMKCGDRLEILTIAVDPEFRRQGIALALLEKIKKACQNKTVTSLDIEVSKNNQPAINLYEGYGFMRVGKRNKYYKEKEASGFRRVDALLYRLDLTNFTEC